MKGAIGQLMQQAQAMQKNMQEQQSKLAQEETLGEAGAGMVKVTMTGKQVTRVSIEDELLTDDKDMLEDLVAAALNDALTKVDSKQAELMQGMGAGLNLPPGLDLSKLGL